MKPNQTLTQGNLQIALFPMEYLTITQGRDNRPTHMGIDAYDLAGKDSGKDKWYAPFDIEVIWLEANNNKTGVVVTNTGRVLLANGVIAEPRTIGIMLWHDDYIDGLSIGNQFKQGVYFYEEGTAGMATGNHIHMELSIFDIRNKNNPFDVTPHGYLTIKGTALRIEDAFFINDTIVKNAWGYNFKTYKYTAETHTHTPEVWAFTANTDINIREYHTTDSKIVGRLSKGQTYNYIQKYETKTHVWVSNGKTWVAVRKVMDGKRQELWGELHAQKNVPQKENLYEGKFKVGQKIEFSTRYYSHHQDQIIESGKLTGYIIHIYPEDKYQLAISDTKGGKQNGATKPVNVYRILG